jgi:hypothetical protein
MRLGGQFLMSEFNYTKFHCILLLPSFLIFKLPSIGFCQNCFTFPFRGLQALGWEVDKSDLTCVLYKLCCGLCVGVAEHLGCGNVIVFVLK